MPCTYQLIDKSTFPNYQKVHLCNGYFGIKMNNHHLNTFYVSFASVRALADGRILYFTELFQRNFCCPAFESRLYYHAVGGTTTFSTVEGEHEPNRREFQKQCAFQSFCKRVLHNEACNAHDEIRRRRKREVSFCDLALHEERQLYTVDKYFSRRRS